MNSLLRRLVSNCNRVFLFAIFILSALLGGPAESAAGDIDWIRTNGPAGGYVIALAADSDGRVLAATVSGGLWLSRDNGSTWERPGQPPATPRGITFGTDAIYCVLPVKAIVRSTDEGLSWKTLDAPAAASTFGNPLLARGAQEIYLNAGDGLYRSKTRGLAWASLPIPFDAEGRLTALTTFGDEELYIAVKSEPGLLRSTDNGFSWTAKGVSTLPSEVRALAMNSQAEIFALQRSRAGVPSRLLRSSDRGDTWLLEADSLRTPQFLTMTSGDDLFVGLNGGIILQRRSDNAEWEPVSSIPAGLLVRALTETSSGRLLIATQKGIYASDDRAESWRESNSGLTSIAAQIAHFPQNGLLAVSQSSGTFRSSDRGDTWRQIQEPGSLAIEELADGSLISGIGERGVILSTDRGDTWREANPQYWGPICEQRYCLFNNFTQAENGDIYLLLDQENLLVSQDGGFQWRELITRVGAGTNAAIWNNTSIYFAGERLRITRDFGLSVSTVDAIPAQTSVSQVVNAGNRFIAAGTVFGIFLTRDDGLTWEQTLTQQLIRHLAVTTKGAMAALSLDSVFVAGDAGLNWQSSALPQLVRQEALGVALDEAGTIFLSSNEGIFRSSRPVVSHVLPGTAAETETSAASIVPAIHSHISVSTLELRYELRHAASVEIGLYTLQGAKLYHSRQRPLLPGSHVFTIATAGLAAGPYLVILKAGDERHARMLLLK